MLDEPPPAFAVLDPGVVAGTFHNGCDVDSAAEGHRRAESGASALPVVSVPDDSSPFTVTTATAAPLPVAVRLLTGAPAADAAFLGVDSAGRASTVSGWLVACGAHWDRAASTVSITTECASARTLALRRTSRGLTNPSSPTPALTGPATAGLAQGL